MRTLHRQTKVVDYSDYAATQIVQTVNYEYDVLGRRISKPNPCGCGAEYYIYDGDHIALTIDTAGKVSERNFWAAGIDQILAVEKVSYQSGLYVTDETLWALSDNQGTVRQLFGKEGSTYQVLRTIQYDAFGKPISEASHTTGHEHEIAFHYVGQQFDHETGQTKVSGTNGINFLISLCPTCVKHCYQVICHTALS